MFYLCRQRGKQPYLYGYLTNSVSGTFVCFAPYDDPEIALALVIERGNSGSALAAAAVEVLNAYFTAGEDAAVTGENQLLP